MIELKVPVVGESVTEAVIGGWYIAEGDWIAEGQPVVEIETDKVNAEITAPVSGRLVAIKKRQGETATVAEVIGLMEAAEKPATHDQPAADKPAADKPAADKPAADKPAANKPAADKPAANQTTPRSPSPTQAAALQIPPPANQPPGPEPRVMPAARRILAQQGRDSATVTGTGPGGRILKEDAARAPRATSETVADVAPPAAPAPSLQPPTSDRTETEIPMTPLRKRVAERLLAAQHEAALLTTFNEVDMSAVMALRARYKDAFLARHGVKLGFMSFFVKAVISALEEVKAIGAEVRGDRVVYRNYHDIGIAVGGGKGLVVPVLRNAERLDFAAIEQAIADFALRARDGKLKLEELQGGTFTISNGGVYGSMLSTPIVNPPQSGILGMHRIDERPVARDGQVVIRPMMYVALTYDHRLVDGREAVTFLMRVKDTIEDPSRLLLEV